MPRSVVAAGRQAVGTVGQRGVGVGVEHYQRVRRLVDVQAAVHAELHVAGVGAEISHGLAGYAVFAGGVAGHALGLGGLVQTAALGVDGLDQLGLALVLEAAQRVEGTEDDAGGAAAPSLLLAPRITPAPWWTLRLQNTLRRATE